MKKIVNERTAFSKLSQGSCASIFVVSISIPANAKTQLGPTVFSGAIGTPMSSHVFRKVKWKTRSAECGVRSVENGGVRSVENMECGKCGVWKMGSVENAECRKCVVWKMRSVENAECGKCGVWKMRSVKEKHIKSLKEKKKVISPHVGITPNQDG